MKYFFGLTSLIVALGIVAWLAKTQLHALRASLPSASAPTAGAAPAGRESASAAATSAAGEAVNASPAQISRDFQQKMKTDVEQALQQGVKSRGEP